MDYEYTEEDYKELEDALKKTEMVCYGRPDQFQYYQNELSKTIARFLLKPYLHPKIEKEAEDNKVFVKFFENKDEK